MKKFAFVVPRFGEGISGGAETLVGNLARALSERGDDVTVLTTCAADHRTWENAFPEGDSEAFGVPVKRFTVDSRNIDAWIPLQIRLSEGMQLTLEEELHWMSESVNAQALYQWLEGHAENFDLIFFAPYLFGVSFFGALTVPDKAVLIPCLHDESYAYTQVMGSMFRRVRGCLFNAEPERELAERLYHTEILGGVVGMGFEPVIPPTRHYFTEKFPYLVYLGRKETGKNAHVLIDSFIEAKTLFPELRDVKLVIVGGGSFDDIERPDARHRSDIIDLPPVTEEEKVALLSGAIALTQPSRNESFSIVLMEGWRVGVPALVHARGEVTRYHVIHSGGGLYFDSALEFGGAVALLLRDPKLRDALGSAGRAYVAKEYSWNAVLQRFDDAVKNILSYDEPRKSPDR